MDLHINTQNVHNPHLIDPRLNGNSPPTTHVESSSGFDLQIVKSPARDAFPTNAADEQQQQQHATDQESRTGFATQASETYSGTFSMQTGSAYQVGGQAQSHDGGVLHTQSADFAPASWDNSHLRYQTTQATDVQSGARTQFHSQQPVQPYNHHGEDPEYAGDMPQPTSQTLGPNVRSDYDDYSLYSDIINQPTQSYGGRLSSDFSFNPSGGSPNDITLQANWPVDSPYNGSEIQGAAETYDYPAENTRGHPGAPNSSLPDATHVPQYRYGAARESQFDAAQMPQHNAAHMYQYNAAYMYQHNAAHMPQHGGIYANGTQFPLPAFNNQALLPPAIVSQVHGQLYQQQAITQAAAQSVAPNAPAAARATAKKRGRYTPADEREFRHMVSTNQTDQEIAEKLDRSENAIYLKRKRMQGKFGDPHASDKARRSGGA